MLTIEFEKDKIIIPNKVNFKGKFCGMDSFNKCMDKNWFKSYPYQNFDYNFNSWGFRGEDYEQYLGKPIIACIGDSFTVNIGGPITHSWPSLLQKNFEIPCLNFGIDGCGNDTIRRVYEKVKRLFDVKQTFVVYSFFHRRLENNKLKSDPHEHLDNVKHFENNFIKNIPYQFIPIYCFNEEELNYINKNYEQNSLDYFLSWDPSIKRNSVCEKIYHQLKGDDWPTYEDFVIKGIIHNDIISEDHKLYLKKHLINNRDGQHLNLESNQKLANNLYQQYINLTRGDVK